MNHATMRPALNPSVSKRGALHIYKPHLPTNPPPAHETSLPSVSIPPPVLKPPLKSPLVLDKNRGLFLKTREQNRKSCQRLIHGLQPFGKAHCANTLKRPISSYSSSYALLSTQRKSCKMSFHLK